MKVDECRFDTIRDEWSPFMSIREAGSQFAPYLENIAELGIAGCVGNVNDSSRFNRIVTNRREGDDSSRIDNISNALHYPVQLYFLSMAQIDFRLVELTIRLESCRIESKRELFATPAIDYRE